MNDRVPLTKKGQDKEIHFPNSNVKIDKPS